MDTRKIKMHLGLFKQLDELTQLQIQTMACIANDVLEAAKQLSCTSIPVGVVHNFADTFFDKVQHRIDAIYEEELGIVPH